MAILQKYIRISDDLVNILDPETKQYITYTKTSVFEDGSPMDDSKCDGIYCKLGSEYFKRNYEGFVNFSWLGAKPNTSTDYSALFVYMVSTYKNSYMPIGEWNITTNFNTSNSSVTFVRPFWNGTKLVNGTIIKGRITIYGSYNKFYGVGVTNTLGDGIVIRNDASFNEIHYPITNVQNHGILMEQFGGSAQGNTVYFGLAYGGIHGFVSKTDKATFFCCKSYNASQDGYAIVADNITGQEYPSMCRENRLINCDAYSTNTGVRIYSRDYHSTTNANGIDLRNLAIIGGNIDGTTAYGIGVGDEVVTPSGMTYNDVRNIIITDVNFRNTTTAGVQLARSNGVTLDNNNLGPSIINKASLSGVVLCKNVKYGLGNNSFNAGIGNVVFNYVIPAGATSFDASLVSNVYAETNNTASTSINSISGGKVGQVICIVIKDEFTTIVTTASIKLRRNYIRGNGSFIILKYANDASGWEEIYSYSVGKFQFWPYTAGSYTFNLAFSINSETTIEGDVTSINFTNIPRNHPFKLVMRANSSTIRSISGWDSRIVWQYSGFAPTSINNESNICLTFYYNGTSIFNIGIEGYMYENPSFIKTLRSDKIDSSYTIVPDSNYTIQFTNTLFDLSTISADRILTLPNPVGKRGQEITLYNNNTSSFSWLTSVSIIDNTGSTSGIIPNGTVIELESNNTSWKIKNIYRSGSNGLNFNENLQAKGFLTKSANGTSWLIKVDDSGQIIVLPV